MKIATITTTATEAIMFEILVKLIISKEQFQLFHLFFFFFHINVRHDTFQRNIFKSGFQSFIW